MRDASEWTAATSRESIRANQSGGNQAIVNVPNPPFGTWRPVWWRRSGADTDAAANKSS